MRFCELVLGSDRGGRLTERRDGVVGVEDAMMGSVWGMRLYCLITMVV